MSEDNKPKLPKINLTAEQLAYLFKDLKAEDLLPPKDKTPNRPFYRCDTCHDTKTVMVYGPGPNMPCPCCGPRY